MKATVKKLIVNSKANFDWKAFERLEYENLDSFLSHLDALFQDTLFDYHIERVTVVDFNDLPDSFVTLEGEPNFIHRVGNAFVGEDKKQIDTAELVGKEIAHVGEYPKKLSSREFIETIFSLYPRINFLLVAAVPFILIPAFYANLFNTRLIFNELITTLFYVTTAFILLWGIEYSLKHFVKLKHLSAVDKNALKIERYILSVLPFFRHKDVLTKVRMVESNRKVIWDNLSSLIIDFVNFSLVVALLFVFIGQYALLLLVFYLTIIAISVYLRYRNYTLYIEHESAQQDLLNERISYYRNNKQLRFLDTDATLNNFELVCKKSFESDHGIASFNFNWDEFVRLSSFLASFVLFSTIFFASKADAAIFNVLIALLILNGRAAQSMISMVTKTFFILTSTYHLNTAFKDVFDKLEARLMKKGLSIDTISRIELKNVNVSVEERLLLEGVNLTLTKGNIYAFCGNIGSGKSTLMATILQNHTEYTGNVQFNDFYNGIDLDRSVFSRFVAYLDPSSDFIRGSIYSNFYIRGIRDPNRIAQICSQIFVDIPLDYEFIFQRDISTIDMSTGQKRKLLLYMSLDQHKRLVVLDEAFINLSVGDVVSMLKYIRTELKDAIVLVVTHDRNILGQIKNVYEVKDKRVEQTKTATVRL
ncbi:ABC transporter ATP-binding protein [Vibrio ponticus]|uniref:ABC transporter ATP-binding protein n=1 Tax=Vibrio ponticus TaxID=265668 RepID=A0A3N3DYP1_9VIBR|nr:ABC transporter ATP-binding protein [Vibrio ponticus]ROV59500.1 ABC transporter ATP-binding protein [Vibrio ponticus]